MPYLSLIQEKENKYGNSEKKKRKKKSVIQEEDKGTEVKRSRKAFTKKFYYALLDFVGCAAISIRF